MYKTALAAALLAALSSTPALADHCSRNFGKYETTRDKLEAQFEEAEASEDYEASCAILKQIISHERKALKTFKASCFHNGKGAQWRELGETGLATTETLRDLTCDPLFSE